MATGTTYSEDTSATYLKDLPTFQQEHRWLNVADLPALPVLSWTGPQCLVVLMVSSDKQGGEGPSLQEVQTLIVPVILYQTPLKSTADQDEAFLVKLFLLIENSGRNCRKSS